MSERCMQLGLHDLSPSWPKTPEEEVDETCVLYYQKVLNLWERVSHLEEIKIVPGFQYIDRPRICDVEIPKKFVPFLDRFIKNKKRGLERYLPCSWELESSHPSEEYSNWAQKMYFGWSGKELPMGHIARLTTGHPETITTFYFSQDKELKGYLLQKDYPFPLELPQHLNSIRKPNQKANFKNKKLVYLWHEEPNDTLFPEPRGPKEQIFPWWVRNIETKKGGKPGSKEDWLKYLEKIRKKEPVISGRTFKRVRQSEKAAYDNLERWQNYIHNKYPQVFRFKVKPFKGELGYSVLGRYGYFVSKNPKTYRKLSVEETKQMILKLMPSELQEF
ncbi:MAG: hypothetical protein Q8P91_03440 [bacterium]|nr:hypothetical protein [bacterium]